MRSRVAARGRVVGSGGLWVSSARMVTFSSQHYPRDRRPAKHQTRERADRDRAACSCTSPPCPAERSVPRPTDSSTGWPPRGSAGGRCCRWGRPTATARRTSPARRSRPGRACWPTRARRCRPPRWRTSASATRSGCRRGSSYSARGAVLDQVRFEREWGALRGYAAERGVRLFGDVAIYVSPGGADERFWPELFSRGFVAGAPPDAYSDVGQLWGNPLYDWPALRRRRLPLVGGADPADAVAVRHRADRPLPRARRPTGRCPRGRAPPSTAAGTAVRGCGLFRAIERSLGPGDAVGPDWSGPLSLPLVAEDLGVITEPVERLRRSLGMPGMLVIQFGMDPEDPTSPHRLENHAADRIVYTGHPRPGHHSRLAGVAWPAQRAFVDAELARHGFADARRALVGADPAGVLVAGAGRDRAGPGRARARLGGADEPAGVGGGELALADGRRGADAGAGGAAA